jgi:outer membrane lipoprotein-sorting protein
MSINHRVKLHARRSTLVCVLSWPLTFAHTEEPSGRDILDRVEKLLWGNTVQGTYLMTITTPRWERTLELRVWMDRPRRSFVRITSPAKEAGVGSLRIGSEMWNYLPNVERTIKIPPSMMLQPWMGSDFTNDDLVKESSILDDYTHRVTGSVMVQGDAAWQVEALPKADAAVVWGRIVYTVRRSDSMPLKQEFFSERGELARVLTFSDVRRVSDRVMPTRWEMRPTAKPGQSTTIVLKEARFNQPVDDEIFTQRHLQRKG